MSRPDLNQSQLSELTSGEGKTAVATPAASQGSAGETFLGRWSRRKRVEPESRVNEDAQVAAELARQQEQEQARLREARAALDKGATQPPLTVPPDLPAIDELTPASDFSRFMRPDVPLASRNAAMKKLFTDPHFNVMDGLDIYIDDYTSSSLCASRCCVDWHSHACSSCSTTTRKMPKTPNRQDSRHRHRQRQAHRLSRRHLLAQMLIAMRTRLPVPPMAAESSVVRQNSITAVVAQSAAQSDPLLPRNRPD